MDDLVSIIITTYKGTQTIGRAIKSVISQTYYNWELLIIDDNSPESEERTSTKTIIDTFNDSRIIYIANTKHVNGAYARNIGMKYAKGAYIAFLDDDDIFCSERIERCVNVLKNNAQYDSVYSSVLIITHSLITSRVRSRLSGNLEKDLLLNKNMFGTGSNMFFSSRAIIRTGFFDESFERYQDIEYWLRFFQKHEIYVIPEYLVIKISNRGKSIPEIESLVLAKKKFCHKFKSLIEKLSNEERSCFFNKEVNELYEVGILKYGNDKYVKSVCHEFAKNFNKTISVKTRIKIFIKLYLKYWIHLFYLWKHYLILLTDKDIKACYQTNFKEYFYEN